jgi:hypothetical protein
MPPEDSKSDKARFPDAAAAALNEVEASGKGALDFARGKSPITDDDGRHQAQGVLGALFIAVATAAKVAQRALFPTPEEKARSVKKVADYISEHPFDHLSDPHRNMLLKTLTPDSKGNAVRDVLDRIDPKARTRISDHIAFEAEVDVHEPAKAIERIATELKRRGAEVACC